MMITKVSILLMSVGSLVFGLLTGNELLAIAGAILFLIFELLDLSVEYKEAKLFRAGKWNPNEKRHILDVVVHRFGQGMVLTGLVLTVFQRTSGMIMWVGTIICYLISGWIAQHVAGIPLEMGYGGWRKPNFRKRH